MDLPNQLLLYFLLIASGQGLVLAFITGLQRPRHRSFFFLALFFLLMALGCTEKSVEGIFFPVRGEELPFPLAMPLAYLPALFLHLKFLIYPDAVFRKRDLLHFLPAFLLDFCSFYLLPWPGLPTLFAVTTNGQHLFMFEILYKLYFLMHFLIYTMALAKLRDVERVKDEAGIKFKWSQRMIPVLVVFWASWAIINFIGKGNVLGYSLSFFVHTAAMVSIYWFGFSFLLGTKGSFVAQLRRGSGPLQSVAQTIIEKIKHSEVYKNQQITLAEVASQIGCSQKSVSMAINSCHRLNFNAFINYLRVEAFKDSVNDPKFRHLSLFGIAQEVGFSSKASFHRAFKKECGLTPGEYMAERG